MTYKALLLRALLAGLVAGIAMASYSLAVIEPVIDEAVAAEGAAAPGTHAHGDGDGTTDEEGHEDEGEMFSRSTQKGGGVVASIVYAVVIAFVFGSVFALVRHRLHMSSDVGRSGFLAAVSFATIALVPAVRYPANPPGVGDPATVGQRTMQYLALLVASVALAVLLCWFAGWLRTRVDASVRPALVVVAVVVAYGLLLVVVPASPDTVGPDTSAQLLWDFRVRSIGGLALLWACIGTIFGWLVARGGDPFPIDDRGDELVGSRP